MSTEAEGLFQAGALYKRRLGLKPSPNSSLLSLVGFRAGGFAIYHDDDPYYHFDLNGRWQRSMIGGSHILKNLDGSATAVDRIREGENLVIHRRALETDEIHQIDEKIRLDAVRLHDLLISNQLCTLNPPAPANPVPLDDLLAFLRKIASWTPQAWLDQRQLFDTTYGQSPLPFVPPEIRTAIPVLAVALDHTNGYQDHLANIARLWGTRLLQSRIIFLASSSLFEQDPDSIERYLSITNQQLPLDLSMATTRVHLREETLESHRFQGIHGSIQNCEAGRLPSVSEWSLYRTLGLVKIHLLLDCAQAWNVQAMQTLVQNLKNAGIRVGLVVPLHHSDPDFDFESHLQATINLVLALDLDSDNLVTILAQNDPMVSPTVYLDRQTAFRRQAKEVLAPRKIKLVVSFVDDNA